MERILHQVWVGPYPMPAREQNFVHAFATRGDFQHRLWTNDTIPAMPAAVQERFDWRMQQKDYAFAADIARIYVVWLFGGIYLDVDTEMKLGFDGLEVDAMKGIFRHHQDGDPTFSNDFLGMSKGHPLGEYLLRTMVTPAYDFGPHWLGYAVKSYLGLSKDAPHADVRKALYAVGMMYIPSGLDEAQGTGITPWNFRFQNHSLYSWSAENRKRFEAGEAK